MGDGRGTKTKRHSFFKVLVGDFTNQLRIPRAFLNHFHGKLPKQSVLKSPTGRFRVVEMEKIKEDLVFCDGWETFVKEHGLEFGDFLVFRYIGHCIFKVKIYGTNACEKDIDLVVSSKTDAESNSHKKERKVEHASTEKCTKFPCFDVTSHHVKEKKNNIESKSHKKKQKVDHVATEKCASSPMFNEYSCEVQETKKMTASNEKKNGAYVKRKRIPIVRIEDNGVVDSYSCFIANCRPCTKFSLMVPKKVAEENGFNMKNSVMLRDPDGKLWKVKIVKKSDGRFVLDRGWNAFWKEHNLGGGEICRFKCFDNEISVEIFRGGLGEYQSENQLK